MFVYKLQLQEVVVHRHAHTHAYTQMCTRRRAHLHTHRCKHADMHTQGHTHTCTHGRAYSRTRTQRSKHVDAHTQTRRDRNVKTGAYGQTRAHTHALMHRCTHEDEHALHRQTDTHAHVRAYTDAYIKKRAHRCAPTDMRRQTLLCAHTDRHT